MLNLHEKDFIHEEYRHNPSAFWKGLAMILVFSFLFLGAVLFYYSTLARQYNQNPFLQVTNREMSIFLWQNPQFMRGHVKNKNGYLPAFEYAERIGLKPEYAEDYVIAPPDLLFLYHTWNRLLGSVFIPRVISGKEFSVFLSAAPEWTARYWSEAPKEYLDLLDRMDHLSDQNLELDHLPLAVRQAFVGWKNYFFEGDQINEKQFTYDDVSKLLSLYPQYGKAFWGNIVGDSYLKNYQHGMVSSEELSPFLRAALFNLGVE